MAQSLRPRRNRTVIATAVLLLLIAACGIVWSGGAGIFTSTQAACGPVDGGPGVATDKEDYQPSETVIITGCAMEAYNGQNLLLTITRPDGVVDSTTVTISSGGFTYNYLLNGIVGDYTVKVMDGANLVASTTFTDHTSSVLLIDNDAAVTNDLPVTLNISWAGSGGDPTQARFANVGNVLLGCPSPLDPSWSAWMAITEDGTTNTDTFPWTLAAGAHALRKVCMQTGHGPVGTPDALTILTDDDTIWYVVANPPLAESCGLDMVLVIDSSGSINSTELGQMKTAFKAFVSAFLPETPTEMAVVEFDDSAAVTQAFTSNETSLNNAIDAAASGGFTNWDDALYDARSLFPHRPTKQDLIVFASDGNPNRRGGNGALGHSAPVAAVTEAEAMDWATDQSDQAKTDGARILGLGIGSDLDAVNMSAVTGNVKSPPAPIDENVDVITTGFSTLASDLATLAAALCGGITVHKVIDTDGNLGTTGDQITAGSPVDNWCYTPTSSGGTVSPLNDCTDITGTTDTFQITPSGNYTVSMAETVKPGYALVGANCTGANSNGTFDGVDSVDGINLDTTDIVSCTFYNTELGMIEWEKRNESVSPPHPLQGGATFTVGGASGPFACDGNLTNPVTVVDNGANDADPDPGQLKLNSVCPGAYIVTETAAPAGFALDDDTTRSVTVASGSLNQVIGTQGFDDDGNTDESDFHNRLGSIEWEKREEAGSPPHPLQGGATFTVGGASGPFVCTGNFPITVVDNGVNDADPDPGQVKVNNVCLGSYTVTETAAPSSAYSVDDDPTRAVTVSNAELNPVIGVQGTDEDGNTDESDFHNIPTGTIIIVKDTVPNGPQDFSFTDNIPGCTVGPLDDDADGTLLNMVTCSNVNAATDPYTVTETDPGPAFVLTGLVCNDGNSTVNLGTRTATINLEPGETVICTFTNKTTAQFIVNKDFQPNDPQNVNVILTCTLGTVANDDPSASEADPANFTVLGFSSPASCSATENPVPPT